MALNLVQVEFYNHARIDSAYRTYMRFYTQSSLTRTIRKPSAFTRAMIAVEPTEKTCIPKRMPYQDFRKIMADFVGLEAFRVPPSPPAVSRRLPMSVSIDRNPHSIGLKVCSDSIWRRVGACRDVKGPLAP